MENFTAGDTFFIELKEIKKLIEERAKLEGNSKNDPVNAQYYDWLFKKKPDNHLDLTMKDLIPLDNADFIKFYPYNYSLDFNHKVAFGATKLFTYLNNFNFYKTNKILYLVKK